MWLVYSYRLNRVPGPVIALDCPRCEARGVPSNSYDQFDEVFLFWVLPILKHWSAWVECGHCGAPLHSRLPTRALPALSPPERAKVVGLRVSLIAKFLAIASVLLGWTPLVGLVLGVAGLAANWRSFGWPKVLSRVGFGLALVMSLVFGIILLSRAQEPDRSPSGGPSPDRFAPAALSTDR